MQPVLAELNERGNRCLLHFRFDTQTKDAVKSIPGARFVPRDQGGPHWSLPLELTTMRVLREKLGNSLTLGEALKAWGREAVARERNLHALAAADDHPLEDMAISEKIPEMAQWLRPYQRADIAFLAQAKAALNLNEQRLGKTPEMIGTIYEAGLENGVHLIVALQKSLDSVWRMEFERWTDIPVFTFSGDTNSTDRAKAIARAERYYEEGQPFVFVTTAAMIRRGLPDGLELACDWTTFIIDEYHKTGLPETKNVFPKKCQTIRAERRYAMSGTPMGGKPLKIWGGLHFLDADAFPARGRWSDIWLEVTDEYQHHKKYGGIKKGLEDKFYEALAPYAVRRLRSEVLTELPPKQYIDVWCDMTPVQKKQYEVFAKDAEIRIDEYHLSATSILAEYTRLKQFANARCEVEILGVPDEDTGAIPMKVVPTFDSGKLAYLWENLIGQGIDPEDETGASQAIICSQFREHAEMISRWLNEQGVNNALFTGKTNKKESARIQAAFKRGNDTEGLRVCVMVTTMGVGITLDNVETVHEFDETWVPDDEDQVTDRAINTTSNHQVTVFRYRSKGTIEEMIYGVTTEKSELNKEILDERRRLFKERLVAA